MATSTFLHRFIPNAKKSIVARLYSLIPHSNMGGGKSGATMSAREEDISKMLKCNTHLGTKNCDVLMEPYVFKRRTDGKLSPVTDSRVACTTCPRLRQHCGNETSRLPYPLDVSSKFSVFMNVFL